MYSLNIAPPLGAFIVGVLLGPIMLQYTSERLKILAMDDLMSEVDQYERSINRIFFVIVIIFIGIAGICFVRL
jgi:hypothetical protein